MLNNLIYSINVILPVFLLVALGFFLGKTGFFSDGFLECAEKTVFRIALPVMLFLEVAKAEISFEKNAGLIIYCICAVTISFLTVSVLVAFFMKDPVKRGAFVQGGCRSNFAVLGVPLAASMFGESGTETIALLMPFVIIMFNSYSVIILSLFAPKNDKRSFSETAKLLLVNIIKNPLIIAVMLALPFLISGLQLPVFANKSLTYISNMTTPLALICLGANFRTESLSGRIGAAVTATAVKTVILPAAAVGAAALLGFRNEALGAIFILFASPSAVSSYIMAKNMKNDSDLAAQILLFSTFICILTIFTGVFILKTAALI